MSEPHFPVYKTFCMHNLLEIETGCFEWIFRCFYCLQFGYFEVSNHYTFANWRARKKLKTGQVILQLAMDELSMLKVKNAGVPYFFGNNFINIVFPMAIIEASP